MAIKGESSSTGLLPRHLRFLFWVYLTGLLFFTGFRVILLATQLHQAALLPHPVKLLAEAFFMGWRFDTSISGYLLALPVLALALASVFNLRGRWLYHLVSLYLLLAYTVAFFICCADIPWFNYFFTRLNVNALTWMDSFGTVAGMVFQEARFYIFFILFLVVAAAFALILGKLKARFLKEDDYYPIRPALRQMSTNFTLSLAVFALTFVGIRGRVAGKMPLQVGTAFFSEYPFPGLLGLNPVFTFMRSWLDASNPKNAALHLMDDTAALAQAKAWLHVPPETRSEPSLARPVPGRPDPLRANVVVVIMESMSAAKMGRYGNPDNLTPTLDSLAKVSWTFDEVFTTGMHTYAGVYSTLFSYPVLLEKHPMKGGVVPPLTGLGRSLENQGYQTIFFTTHDDQFDNMGGFLSFNGFQQIVGQKDYPAAKVVSTFGVPDDYLFEYAVPRLNRLHETGPFCAVLLTVSDHGPYIVPEGIPFRPHCREKTKATTEYADWSIAKFLKLARQTAWFDSTLFVFIADHGAFVGENRYELPLSLFHSPLIFYAPQLLGPPRSFDCLGSQMDVYPTIMGILGLPYTNTTFGLDLLRETRPYALFCADYKVGALSRDWFWVWRSQDRREALYRWAAKDPDNLADQDRPAADSLKTFAFSCLQAAQEVVGKSTVHREPLTEHRAP